MRIKVKCYSELKPRYNIATDSYEFMKVDIKSPADLEWVDGVPYKVSYTKDSMVDVEVEIADEVVRQIIAKTVAKISDHVGWPVEELEKLL